MPLLSGVIQGVNKKQKTKIVAVTWSQYDTMLCLSTFSSQFQWHKRREDWSICYQIWTAYYILTAQTHKVDILKLGWKVDCQEKVAFFKLREKVSTANINPKKYVSSITVYACVCICVCEGERGRRMEEEWVGDGGGSAWKILICYSRGRNLHIVHIASYFYDCSVSSCSLLSCKW